ncbi:hypothetical protein [Usitatibacter palustris]|uniref:LTXXQ motif family protein n=1 Tax=Usitatibacter palustris TaxID=2732487 RepID=A0A6M4HCK8_9PROT|nr:hypothetical protein [Usitatibacter palustris]QJR16254.1 hypothetical protein DSM104440_03083 [Usitatibacter palustris]
MKRAATALCIAALAVSAAITAYAAGPHSQERHAGTVHSASNRLSLDQGRKWSTDEALRRSMEEIRAALAQHRDAILRDMLSTDQERALGRTIENRVAAILGESRLEASAAANLQLVVADLVQAADILKGMANPHGLRGDTLAVRATQMYATYFEHPGWKPVF